MKALSAYFSELDVPAITFSALLRCKRVIESPNSAYPRGKGINAGANSAIPRGLGYAGIITHGLYRKKEQYDKHTPPFAINLQYTAPNSLPFL